MALFWLAWNAVQCTFGIAPIFVLKSAVIYILSFLEHEEINIWVISCRNEKGGVFGEGVLFFLFLSLRSLNVTRLFMAEKKILLSYSKRAIRHIIENK